MLFAPGSSVGNHEKYSFSEVTFFAEKSPAIVPQDPKILILVSFSNSHAFRRVTLQFALDYINLLGEYVYISFFEA